MHRTHYITGGIVCIFVTGNYHALPGWLRITSCNSFQQLLSFVIRHFPRTEQKQKQYRHERCAPAEFRTGRNRRMRHIIIQPHLFFSPALNLRSTGALKCQISFILPSMHLQISIRFLSDYYQITFSFQSDIFQISFSTLVYIHRSPERSDCRIY